MLDDPEDKQKPIGTGLERAVLVGLSLVTIVLPILEIILRKTRGQGLLGSSGYVKHATVWIGFLGALLASSAHKHLGLATTSFFKKGRAQSRLMVLSSAIAAMVTLVLAIAAASAVNQHRGGNELIATIGSFAIQTWWAEAIMPVALVLMVARFIWHTPSLDPAGGRPYSGRLISLATCVGTIAAIYLTREHPTIVVWIGLAVLLAAFLAGTPVFVAMAGVSMLLLWKVGTTVDTVPEAALQLAQNPTLPAIPLFTLAGYVLAAGKASQRLVRAFNSLFGWMPGGLAVMATVVCAFFTTLTGGSGVTILALGGLLLPSLLKEKYPEGFSLGLLTAAGSLGLLFAPSLPVVLYGAVGGVAPERIWRGGFVPGMLLILVVCAYSIYIGVKHHAPKQRFSLAEMARATWAALPDLGLPVVVIVVLKLGWATPVEAAAVGAAYALVVELVIHPDLRLKHGVSRVVAQSTALVGAVLILMGVALGFSSLLVDQQIPEALVDWVKTHLHSQWSFLLVLNAMLLVLGSVFEIYAAIIVLAPLVAPMAREFNIDPVHLGVIFLSNLELGFLLPPMGLNLLLAASRFEKPLPYLYRHALPFLLFMTVGVLIITYVPWLTVAFSQP